MKRKKIIRADLDHIIHKIIDNYQPEKIILFGSIAKGDSTETSDYDLLVIKPTATPRLRRRAEVFKDITYNIPIDLIVLTPEEIQTLLNNKSLFIHEILEEGVVLYEH